MQWTTVTSPLCARLPGPILLRASHRAFATRKSVFASPVKPRYFAAMNETLKGESGATYKIEKLLQDKGHPLGRVFLASDGSKPVILKEIAQDWGCRNAIYTRTSDCSHVRKLSDTIPDRKMFVFEYLNEDLLGLTWKKLPIPVTKSILKAGLRGIAALHERNIHHNDIKGDNFLVQMTSNDSEIKIQKVELGDLEDSASVPEGKGIVGAQLGNEMWRSPESHAMGPIKKAADMFSFGLVCLFAMTQILPFAVDATKLDPDQLKLSVILERQVSYFAEQDTLEGLVQYLGEKNEFVPIFRLIWNGYGEHFPRKPFALWEILNVEDKDILKDLVLKLTNFDPTKRLTAAQALQHEWFKDVQDI